PCAHGRSKLVDHSLQQEPTMEIDQLSFPSKDGLLGFLKGTRGGIAPHPLGACLDHLPEHADRSFHTCHEGLFGLGKVARAARTFVHDTAPMIRCGIGRMTLKDNRLACWALEL